MRTLAVILFVLPFAWLAVVGTSVFIGRAGRQGLFFGMIGNRTSDADAKAFTDRALRHQQTLGAVGSRLWKAWPIALVSFGVGIGLMATL